MSGEVPHSSDAPGERRPSSPRRTWLALLLVLPPLVLFSETLFGDKVLSQLDALLAFQPWKTVAPEGYTPENSLLLDQALLTRPWLEYSAERIRNGELPLWNPYNFCGQPITAAVTGATYWPLHFAYYALPTPRFHAWAAALRVFLAGLFTWLFLRHIGVAPATSLLGATAFMQCGFTIAWLNHPHTNAALCLPLLLWQIERLAQRPTARRTAVLGACVALPLLGGHLQTATHVLLTAGAYALFRGRVALQSPALGARGLLQFALGCTLGVALAAPQLVPFGEYYLASLGKDLLDAYDTASPFDRGAALQLMVLPDSLGGPHTGDYRGPIGFNLNYNELIGGYVGRLPLVLAALQLVFLRRSRASWFFAALVLLGALVAWRVPPVYEAARSIPLLRSTKLMRLLLVVAFGLAVLASLGLDRLLKRVSPARAVWLAVGVATLASLDLTLWGRDYNPAIDRERIAPKTPVSEFLAAQLLMGDSPYRVLGVDNHIFLPNANLYHRVPMVSGYDSIEYRPMAELVTRLSRAPFAGFEEILGDGPLPDANFIKEIRWFDRPEGHPLLSLLGVKYLLSEVPLPAPFVHVFGEELQVFENPDVMPRVFVANRWVVQPDKYERLDTLSAAEFDPLLAVLEEPPPAGFETPVPADGAVRITSYAPRSIDLDADMRHRGLVVLADAWDPGWHARTRALDGSTRELSIKRVDHALRGFFLDSGVHRVELRYEPWTTTVGLWTAFLAALVCLGMTLRGSFLRTPVGRD